MCYTKPNQKGNLGCEVFVWKVKNMGEKSYLVFLLPNRFGIKCFTTLSATPPLYFLLALLNFYRKKTCLQLIAVFHNFTHPAELQEQCLNDILCK